MGTALIIACAHEGTWAGLLSLPIVVGAGLISYSAYLWHHPLFAFARIRTLDEVSLSAYGALILLTLLLAYISWRFVETPFRGKHIVSRRILLASVVLASAMLLGAGVYGHVSGGGMQRFDAKQASVLELLRYPRAKVYREGACFLTPEQQAADFAPECHSGLKHGPRRPLVVWGDSHAASLHMGIFAAAGPAGKVQLTASRCPPLMGYFVATRPHCHQAINDRVLALLASAVEPRVFLAANWINDTKHADMRPYLRKTIAAIHSMGGEVVLVGSLPRWSPSLPERLLREMLISGVGLDRLASRYHPSRLQELESIDGVLKDVAQEYKIRMVSVIDTLCTNEGCSVFVERDAIRELIVWDQAHLTLAGSLLVGKNVVDPEIPEPAAGSTER